MKIALFLGSFNPFHNGHLECIKKALNDFKMDGVVIVPIMQNDLDRGERILEMKKRLLLIEKILVHEFGYYVHEKILVDPIEEILIPPYYSYATLHALKNKYCDNEIFILCGEDTIEDIPNCMNGGAIIKDYNFLVVDRPKDSISSSRIREMLRTRNKIDAHYSDEKLGRYVSPNVINLLKEYY